MENPLVSIVTPCHDDGEFLRLPIQSVIEQPYENFEMIIVDDGSTDPATLRVLDSVRHPKLRVIRQKNQGLPGARNSGIRAAKGKYIVPLDADDKISPACLSRSVDVLEADPGVAMVYGNYELFGDEQGSIRTGEFNTYRILFHNYLPVGSMFRRSAWEAVGGYAESMTSGFEDWEFWIKLIERGFRFRKVDDVFLLYHRHGQTMLDGSRRIYKKLVAQIRALHPELYSEESLRRLRELNGITWIEDAIYRLPFPLRRRLANSPLRSLVPWVQRMGFCHNL